MLRETSDLGKFRLKPSTGRSLIVLPMSSRSQLVRLPRLPLFG